MVIKSLPKRHSLSIARLLWKGVPTKLVNEAGDNAWLIVPIIGHNKARGSSLHFLSFVR